ncbi:MAG TPA: anti-sigma factor [Ideonella sp.]|uniref:anti-sigma factor family protein n=1 Tax=Ideonella sp. TaxID=1929293 RepID=UPI002C036BFA|nr:anti-sigma factor [Ideonella sp.]HSI47021.1 anti-sigma factor [Ideonella sp.]
MTPDPHPEREDEQDAELSALLRQHASRHTAGGALRAAIHTQVALADASRAAAKPSRWRALRDGLGATAWHKPALAFALGLACALPLSQWHRIANPPAVAAAEQPIQPAELVASHVRALGGGPLYQIASSDRHTVKPWYQGKLDYAPPVPDLSQQGFPLAGGRIEALHGEATAVLAYMRRLHVIDVYVRPSTEPAAVPELRTERGFHVVQWRNGGMQCWAVSDLEAAELQKFAAEWQAKTIGP